MDRAWKLIGLIILAVAAYAAWEYKAIETDMQRRVTAVAEQLDPELWDYRRTPRQSSAAFLRAIVTVHQATQPNRARVFFGSRTQKAEWFIDAALEKRQTTPMAKQLVRSALLEAIDDCDEWGILDSTTGNAALERGDEPEIVAGAFSGLKAKVGWHVSPVVAPEVINHPANFTLQPEPVWAVQQDRLDGESFQHAQGLHGANILDELAWIRVQAYWKDGAAKNK